MQKFSAPSSSKVQHQQDAGGRAPSVLQGTWSQSNVLLLCKMSRAPRKGPWMEKSNQNAPKQSKRDLGCLHRGCSLLTFPPGLTSQI